MKITLRCTDMDICLDAGCTKDSLHATIKEKVTIARTISVQRTVAGGLLIDPMSMNTEKKAFTNVYS